ncbi:MAG: cytochrome c [Leptospirales bacterium]|jgi:mono/diheme cytochrome c family protein
MQSFKSHYLRNPRRRAARKPGRIYFAAAILTVSAFSVWNTDWLVGGEERGGLRAQSQMESDTAAIMRGRRIYEKRCVMCHGLTGKGDGIRAMSLDVRPANLSMSRLSDAEQERIIEKGGAAVGRSPLMPVWGSEFSRKEIKDLVKYLRAINIARK